MAVKDSSGAPDNPFHPLSCATVEDLYRASGRQRVQAVTATWLLHQRLTVTEFMHSAAALNKFEAAGTSFQHAVQRMAVTLSSKSNVPVVQYVKALTALSSAAIRKVRNDELAGLFPELDAKGLVGLAQTLAGRADALYCFNGALAKYLQATQSWPDKLASLLALADMAAEGTPEHVLISHAVDSMAAEIIGDAKILIELLGADLGLGQRLLAVLRLFGADVGEVPVSESLQRMGEGFARGEFPLSRVALARYVQETCTGNAALASLSLKAELDAFCALVDAIKPLYGADFVAEEYAQAFAVRSRRFVTPEALFQFTAHLKAPDDKLQAVLDLEGKVEGAANRRALGPFAVTFLSGSDFEQNVAIGAPGAQRLKRLADLQRQILASGFPENMREQMAERLDTIALRIEGQGRLINGLEARFSDPAERVDMIMKLFENGVFTQGTLISKARRAVLSAMSTPGFAAAYTAMRQMEKKAALMALVMQLKNFGIGPEESVRTLSAA